MRMMLKWAVPVEKGNQAAKDGSLPATVDGLMQDLKPEAAYFTLEDGKRAGWIVFDMSDPAQIKHIAERLFSKLNATVELTPAMSADDLKRGRNA